MEKIKAGYRREMNHNYMIIEAFSDDTECYESRMLSGNTIEGLLKFRQKITETGIEFYYEITSKQPLSRLLEGRLISYEEIKEKGGSYAGKEQIKKRRTFCAPLFLLFYFIRFVHPSCPTGMEPRRHRDTPVTPKSLAKFSLHWTVSVSSYHTKYRLPSSVV